MDAIEEDPTPSLQASDLEDSAATAAATESEEEEEEDAEQPTKKRPRATTTSTTTTAAKNTVSYLRLMEFRKKKMEQKCFAFITSQANFLHIMVKCYASLFTELVFRITVGSDNDEETKDGLCMQATTTNKTCTLLWTLPADSQDEGELLLPRQSKQFTVRAELLLSELAGYKDAHVVYFSLDNDEDPSKLKICADFDTRFSTSSINLMTRPTQEMLNVPNVKYSNEAVFSSTEFMQVLLAGGSGKDIDRTGFHVSGSLFYIALMKQVSTRTSCLPIASPGDEKAYELVETPSYYNHELLVNITKLTKATKYVWVHLPQKTQAGVEVSLPLCLRYEAAKLGTCVFFVCPMIESDADEFSPMLSVLEEAKKDAELGCTSADKR